MTVKEKEIKVWLFMVITIVQIKETDVIYGWWGSNEKGKVQHTFHFKELQPFLENYFPI